MDPLLSLGISLAIGLLIGTERGWQEREAPEGGRVAGIRTFGLLGLLGGLFALIAGTLGELLLGFAFLALSAILLAAYIRESRRRGDVGITTLVAALITFALGALAVTGERATAATGAVVTVTLLSLKPVLHRWLRTLQQRELMAAIKLLLISVVVLPALPNRGFGPWDALNPREIWLMVVLIATISFAGYIAMKLVGPRRGVLLTGLLGGTVSSTATTIDLARLARDGGSANVPAAGILLASATMFPRLLVLVAVVDTTLVIPLAIPLGLMAAVLLIATFWLAHGNPERGQALGEFSNPFELRAALGFGAFLALVMLASKALYEWLGSSGLYLAAAAAGIADTDAITLSLARLSREGAPGSIPQAVVTAAIVNTLVKGMLGAGIAGRAMLDKVMPAMLLSAVAGAAGIYVAART
jgi:uncharacterized membrane protein (DUF4010 family)